MKPGSFQQEDAVAKESSSQICHLPICRCSSAPIPKWATAVGGCGRSTGKARKGARGAARGATSEAARGEAADPSGARRTLQHPGHSA